MKTALIRVDSSVEIGTGHLMRCLTLAHQLRARGVEVVWVCRDLPGHFGQLVRQQGFHVMLLPVPTQEQRVTADNTLYGRWLGVAPEVDAEQTLAIMPSRVEYLIVDHYGLDKRFETKFRPHVSRILVLDDLANRAHDCDWLLDQNFVERGAQRYDGLVPPTCRRLLGPRYVLLREEFTNARRNGRVRTGEVLRVLVFFGGSDPTDETTRTLLALQALHCPDLAIDVVAGGANPRREALAALSVKIGATFYGHVQNMAELMSRADLSIGAGGSACWERCYLGLPTLMVIVADNQAELTRAVGQFGAAHVLGTSEEMTVERYVEAIRDVMARPDDLQRMTARSYELMGDVCGEPVADALLEGETG